MRVQRRARRGGAVEAVVEHRGIGRAGVCRVELDLGDAAAEEVRAVRGGRVDRSRWSRSARGSRSCRRWCSRRGRPDGEPGGVKRPPLTDDEPCRATAVPTKMCWGSFGSIATASSASVEREVRGVHAGGDLGEGGAAVGRLEEPEPASESEEPLGSPVPTQMLPSEPIVTEPDGVGRQVGADRRPCRRCSQRIGGLPEPTARRAGVQRAGAGRAGTRGGQRRRAPSHVRCVAGVGRLRSDQAAIRSHGLPGSPVSLHRTGPSRAAARRDPAAWLRGRRPGRPRARTPLLCHVDRLARVGPLVVRLLVGPVLDLAGRLRVAARLGELLRGEGKRNRPLLAQRRVLLQCLTHLVARTPGLVAIAVLARGTSAS